MSLRTIRSVHFFYIENSPEFADDRECNNMTFEDKIRTKRHKYREKNLLQLLKAHDSIQNII